MTDQDKISISISGRVAGQKVPGVKELGAGKMARNTARFDQNVPVERYLDRRDLNDQGDLEWLIEDLISDLENGYFLMWEAVVREEQELPLTEGQEEALSELMSFGDEDEDDRILYVNERARPDEPWYQVVRKVVSHLLLNPFETYGTHYAVDLEGWPRLVECR